MRTEVNAPKWGSISMILIDYGGVLAEEGFREGLFAIARKTGLNEHSFFDVAQEAVYSSGYLTGRSTESDYWNTVRRLTGVNLSDEVMRKEIISRFQLRPVMLKLVRMLREKGLRIVILSDQTNWLDELDSRDNFFCHFDHVYNSFNIGKGKRDASIFPDILGLMSMKPHEVLFIDDNESHVDRAVSSGLSGITFTEPEDLISELRTGGLITEAESERIKMIT